MVMGPLFSLIGILFFCFIYTSLIKCHRLLCNKGGYRIDNSYVIAGRVVSAVQAICACIIGFTVIKQCSGDLLKDRHWLMEFYTWFAVPYFYYDVYAMYNTFWYTTPTIQHLPNKDTIILFFRKEPLMMFHHILLPTILFPVVVWGRNGQGDFFLGCLFLFELVIPFISLRSILKQLKMEDTLLYSINGILLIVVWFLCRVLIFPYMYWQYGKSKDIPLLNVPLKIPLKCNLGCFGLVALQLYWLLYMIKIAVKTVQKRKYRTNQILKESEKSKSNGSNNSYLLFKSKDHISEYLTSNGKCL